MYTWVHKHAPSRPSTYVCIKGSFRLTRVSGELPQTDTFDRSMWGRVAKGWGCQGDGCGSLGVPRALPPTQAVQKNASKHSLDFRVCPSHSAGFRKSRSLVFPQGVGKTLMGISRFAKPAGWNLFSKAVRRP